MTAPIGPGDYVECLRSRILPVGAIYLVEQVTAALPCNCHGGSPFGLRLVGAPNHVGYAAWCGLNFRPVYRRDESLTERLLEGIDTFTPETEDA